MELDNGIYLWGMWDDNNHDLFGDKAYFIIPRHNKDFHNITDIRDMEWYNNGNPYLVEHQYDCNSGSHIAIKGRVAKVWNEELADHLNIRLGCEGIRQLELSGDTDLGHGLIVAELLGEALCRLDSGIYVAIQNCD